ncbi:MAG: hypothetical protein WC325_10430 [Candidatus Bathyarchaeia archaeon]|jgi:hypothetical protein
MKRKINKISVVALTFLLVITSLSTIPITQAYDSYIAVYPTMEGCQSITITDNTNSSYTDTFTTADIFEFDAADSLTLFAEAEAGYVFAYWRFDNPGGGGGWYDSTQNPYTVGGGWVNDYEAVIAYFVVPSISVSIDLPTATWYTESPTLSISYTVTGCTLDTILYDLVWYGIQPPVKNDYAYTTPVDLNIGNGQWALNITAYSSITGLTATDSVSFGVNIPNPTTYTITPSHDGGCTITPNTAQTVAEGGSQGFTYSADTGYNISSVKVDGVEVANTGSYTFSNVVADHTISVTSTEKIQYSNIAVSDTIANKSVTFSSYWTDETVNLLNYTFSTNNTGVWANDTATAFSATPGWANVSKTLNSTIGQTVGYQWFVNDTAGNLNSTAIQTLTTKAYYIGASNDTYSLLEPLGQVAVCYGANQQFNFSALDGYTIENVVINGTYSASTTSPYVFLDIQGNQTIAVSTSEQVWYVNATSDTGCTIDPTGLLMIPAGTWANFTFSANVGYQLYKLYVNGTETASGTTYNFIPTGNTTLYITSTEISTGLPAGGGGGLPTSPPTSTATPEPTLSSFDVDEAARNNIILSVGVAAIAVLVAAVIFAKPAKKTVQHEIKSWNS